PLGDRLDVIGRGEGSELKHGPFSLVATSIRGMTRWRGVLRGCSRTPERHPDGMMLVLLVPPTVTWRFANRAGLGPVRRARPAPYTPGAKRWSARRGRQ